MTKQEIRSEMKKERDRYPHIHRDSMKIWDVLEHRHVYQRIDKLFAYFSFGSEVETFMLMSSAKRRGKAVYLPRVREGNGMDFYEMKDIRHLERNRYGVYEPTGRGGPVEPDEQTMVLVPGLAFDYEGGRIGFGSGYYDRYLQRYPQALSVGICFDFQLREEKLPLAEEDQKVRYLLTPRGVYSVEQGAWI